MPATTTSVNGAALTDACCQPGSPSTYPAHLSFPAGREVKIADIDCYSVNETSPHLVIFSSDIFGWQHTNNRQNANQIAAAGFHVVIPDLFSGDAASTDDFDTKGFGWLLGEWFPRNPQLKTAERLVTVVNQLKKQGEVASVQVVGYCYGAIAALHLYAKGGATAGVFAHPTGFNQDNVSQCDKPTLIICAENDQAFVPEVRQHWERTMKEKMAPARFVDYPGTNHGFAVRDNGSAVEVAARQGALQETIAFLRQGAAL